MRHFVLGIILLLSVSCIDNPRSPEKLIHEYYEFYNRLYTFVYDYDIETDAVENTKLIDQYIKDSNRQFNKLTTNNFRAAQSVFLDSFSWMTVEEFKEIRYEGYEKGDSIVSENIFSSELIFWLRMSQQVSSALQHIAFIDPQEIEVIDITEDKIIFQCSASSSHHIFGEPRIPLDDFLRKWKIENYDLDSLIDQIAYNDKIAAGKGWTFNMKTKEHHYFTLRKIKNDWKIDNFKYDIMSSELSSSYYSVKDQED